MGKHRRQGVGHNSRKSWGRLRGATAAAAVTSLLVAGTVAPTAFASELPPTAKTAAQVPAAQPGILPLLAPSDLTLPGWPATYSTVQDPIGTADTTVYSGGSKEDDPSGWEFNTTAGAPPSGDIGDVFIGSTIDAASDAWLYLAFERTTANGNIGYFLELNQAAPATNGQNVSIPVRTVGDIRIVFPALNDDFGTPAFQVWNGTAWVDQTLTEPLWDFAPSADTTVVEFRFNLTDILSSNGTVLQCGDLAFQQLFLRSGASAQDNSELKDFVGGAVDFDFCADLEIRKFAEDGTTPLAGATFRISPNPLPGGTGDYLDVTDNGTHDDDPADGVVTLDAVNAGTYTVEETAPPAGYLLPADPTSEAQTVAAGGSISFSFNDPLAWQPLAVEKTAEATYDALYKWSVLKDVNETSFTIAEGGTAQAVYTITVSEAGMETSNYLVDGAITVENPNDAPVVATVADTVDGTSCVIDADDADTATEGLQVSFAPGTTTLDYECDFGDTAPAALEGTNTVELEWSREDYPQSQEDVDAGAEAGTATVSDSADFTFAENATDKSVEAFDEFTNPDEDAVQQGGTLTYGVGGLDHRFTIERDFTGVPGQCTTYTNDAYIVSTDDDRELDRDDASTEVCVGQDLTIEKSASLLFDRQFHWLIEKSGPGTLLVGETVDENGDTSVEATLDYEVTVTPNGFTDTAQTLGGTITVENPNVWQAVTGDVTDQVSLLGVACTVVDGEDATIPAATIVEGAVVPGVRTFAYTCEGLAQADYEGTNTAKVQWDNALFATPGLEASDTVDIDVTGPAEGEGLNETVTVLDPLAPAGTFTSVDWHDGAETFTYSVDVEGTVGECVGIDNTATISETGQSASHTATLCSPAVAKTVDAKFDRTFLWDVAKDVDKTKVEIAEDDSATFHYTVKATPDGYRDSNYRISGTITVLNPSGSRELDATVTDAVGIDGVDCTVDGEGVLTVAPGQTVTVDYDCTLPEGFEVPADDAGNTATVSWDGGEATGDAPVEFVIDERIDQTVEVKDDLVNLTDTPQVLGTVSVDDAGDLAEGGTGEFTYDLEQSGVAGECTDYTNTAFVETEGENPSGSETVTVCVEEGLEIEKTVDASFDREYFWDIEKSADETEFTVGSDGEATVDYTVEAIPSGFEDSGWELEGTVTVTNPNSYEGGSITATVKDHPDLGEGVECRVEDGEDVEVAPGESVELDYECWFDQEPEDEGTNTAVAFWEGPRGEELRVETTEDVEFELDHEENDVVTVVDDKTDPESDPVELGEAEWDWDGESTRFTYSLDLEVEADECETFTNTAEIVETGDSDSVDVEVCAEDEWTPEGPGPDSEPVAIEEPEHPDMPQTGSTTLPLAAGGLLLLLCGAAALLIAKRRKA